ncbi:lysophospholipid acyltransferase family protein [Herbiconiux sp. P15]|uniref:lysophospholipid acyltransferase family protein n=1 Tax=Herbiconiux liukaitaii TaxID=3342799 RepID=UPI0035B97568
MPRRRPEPVYTVAIGVGRALFASWRLKHRATGAENIPDVGGAVFAMTHFGYLEFALVEWQTWLHNRRRVRFMATKRAFDKPIVGSLMRGMKHIPVDMAAGADAYAQAVAALRRGEIIGVFPEAGVSASFTVRDLKSGAVRLAAEAGVPIIPVAVWGGHRLLTKNRKVRMRERFGVPVHFAFGPAQHIAPDDDVAAATAELRTTLQSLTDDLQRDYPVDGDGQWWQPVHLNGTAPTVEQAAAADAERDRRRAALQKN